MSRRTTQLAGLDLNLLVVLRELLRERNVTRAAERVGVSQPALSAALARLRRHFDDELLVREGRGYVLTPLARQLGRQVEDVCAAAEQLFATGSSFAPGTSVREFTLLMADYTLAVIGQPLAELFEREAPRARLRIRLVRESLSADLPRVVRFVDGVVAPPIELEELPRLRSAELFRDEWVCVVWAGHDLGSAGLTLADLQRLDWVVPYHREPGVPLPPVSRRLAALGLAPRVAMSVESYQAVPALVVGTHRIALVQRRLAAEFAQHSDISVLECPGEPEGIVETLWWHDDLDLDPAHAWLREALRGIGEALG